MQDRYQQILSRYLPTESTETVYAWIQEHGIHLRISRARKTKLGDYRPPQRGNKTHRISVNHDLNPYAFLITFTHEVAHLVVWKEYGRQARPHGPEWKEQFRQLMRVFLDRNIFPPELHERLMGYMRRLKATNTADVELSRILISYDKADGFMLLEEVPEGGQFIFNDTKRFVKGEKLRKRFKCLNLDNGKTYLFSPVAKVILTGVMQE